MSHQRHVNSSRWESSQHVHNIYEMVLYEKIGGKACLDGGEWDIGDGKLLFIPPYSLHHFNLEKGEARYHVVHFNASFASPFLGHHHLPRAPFVLDLGIDEAQLFTHLFQWRERQWQVGKVSHKVSTECLRLVLTWLGENLSSTFVNDRGTERFRPVFKYLHDQDAFTVSVEVAARMCLISRSHFFAEFKANFGTTFHQFLMNRKMNVAKQYLLNTEMSFTEMAHRLECCDSSYFSKVFRRHFGLSPKDFRHNRDRQVII
jgi:AraC-like DNA-binding protein